MTQLQTKIGQIGIVPVIKLVHPEADAVHLADALCAGGVPIAEITFRAEGADKAMALMVLPGAFAFMGTRDFGFPGIGLELFGIPFKWYIIGYSAQAGGLSYFTAYMVAMVVGEVINFFIQRSVVFRSKGNILYQGMWYLLAFCLITCVVNSINCVCVDVVKYLLPPTLSWLHGVGTTVLNGGISMVVFFFVNKIVFRDKKN
jgi:putative flippase GtrA